MSRPRLLDLFCGGGGAAMGYHRAGFDVVGVDVVDQPHYPFEFHQADAMTFPLEGFDAIHASPPCQAYSAMNAAVKADHPKLIEPVRARLAEAGVAYIIENVEGAPMIDALTLCGSMFGIRVRRHRLFEVRPLLPVLLPSCTCRFGVMRGTLVGHRVAGEVGPGRTKPPHATEADRREAIGCPWMTAREARQAIPPAYTEWIGARLIEHLQAVV